MDTEKYKFIYNILHENVRDTLVVPCYNLSFCLGNKSSYLNAFTTSVIKNYLTLAFPGLVVITDDTTRRVYDVQEESILPWTDVQNQISYKAYQLYYNLAINGDVTDVEEPPIFRGLDLLPLSVKSIVCALAIDIFALYLDLESCTSLDNITSLSKSDVLRMSDNAMWVCSRIERDTMQRDELYQLLENIRSLARILRYIATLIKG